MFVVGLATCWIMMMEWLCKSVHGSKEDSLAAKKCAKCALYNDKKVEGLHKKHDSLKQILKRTAIKSSN